VKMRTKLEEPPPLIGAGANQHGFVTEIDSEHGWRRGRDGGFVVGGLILAQRSQGNGLLTEWAASEALRHWLTTCASRNWGAHSEVRARSITRGISYYSAPKRSPGRGKDGTKSLERGRSEAARDVRGKVGAYRGCTSVRRARGPVSRWNEV